MPTRSPDVAQTKKKRRRKHSGTQAGTIQREPRRARPQTKEEKREATRQRRLERMDRPPTLRGSVSRAAIAAIIFVGVVILILGQTPAQGLAFGAFMFLLYIPIGYFTDSFIYRRRQRKKKQERGERREARRGDR